MNTTPRSFGAALLLHALALGVLARGGAPAIGGMQLYPGTRAALDRVDASQMPQADEEAHTNFTRVEVPQPPLDERIEPLVTLPDELLLEEPLELPKRPAPSYESPSSPAPQGAATFPYLAREQTKPAQAANAKPTAAATNSAPPAAQQPPRIIRPQWPRVIRKGFTGRVLIEVQIASDGRAVRATLIEGTGNAAWDRALRETFEQARYIPGFTNGMPAACTHRFRVTFRHN